MTEIEIREFIEEHVKKLMPLYKKCTLAYWNATSSGKQEDYAEYEKLSLELEKLYNNQEEYENLKKWHSLDIGDSVIKRQVEILYRSYLSSQGDIKLIQEIVKKSTAIEREFNTFRAEIKGRRYTDNEIKEILENELDSEKLREAWEASKRQAELVEKELIELVKLRNKLAREIGFENYYSRNLELGEQTDEEVGRVFEELANLTDKPFFELKKEIDDYLSKRYKTKELQPWHYQDLFFQEGPEIYKINLDSFYKKGVTETADKFYSSLGLEVKDILKRSDLYEREGKYQHAYCTDIDREGDVRIMENVKNNEKWAETTLHELGHAVYDSNFDWGMPFILRDTAHIFVTEAIAMLFGRQSKNINFIKKYSSKKISEKEAEELKELTKKMLRLRQLVFSRWAQVMRNFEKLMYENPEQNLNKLWWDLVKKYQIIDFSRDKPDWASKIHLVSAPVYYHNYLLGELLASQLHNYICESVLKQDANNADYSDKRIGKYLKESIFSLGRRCHWSELIKRATGESLNPKYFAEQFC